MKHLPLPGDHAQHHHEQRERFIGDVPGVQGGDVSDQEGEEGALEESGGGGGEGLTCHPELVEGLGVPPRKASGSGFPLQVRTRRSSSLAGFSLQSVTRNAGNTLLGTSVLFVKEVLQSVDVPDLKPEPFTSLALRCEVLMQ